MGAVVSVFVLITIVIVTAISTVFYYKNIAVNYSGGNMCLSSLSSAWQAYCNYSQQSLLLKTLKHYLCHITNEIFKLKQYDRYLLGIKRQNIRDILDMDKNVK